MTCCHGKSRPMSLYDAKELGGHEHGPWTDEEERACVIEGGAMHICGPGVDPEPPCPCGYFADLLCDYPMGGGKTCDAPLCEGCAYEVGEDRHLCLIHYGQYKGAARVNPWPPKRGEP